MATISGTLYTLDGLSYVISAAVSAYTSASQGMPPLVDQDGNALKPVGASVANTISDSFGAYTLTGLAVAIPYHLYIVPSTGQPYWLYWQMTNPVATVTPCVLYGTSETVNLAASKATVWAALENTAVVSGGIVVTPEVQIAPVGPLGQFRLALWPTASLSPAVLYRVSCGPAVWRGSIPSQASIAFDAWVALTTTQRLS